ncbi:MAG: Sulfate adenylyltransferase subunit 2 [Sodalis sp.]|nr:MAG: Sulfate adenylyltransferase subunit 2 [Sodalis sp.]
MGINLFVHSSAKHTDIMKTEGLKRALNQYGFEPPLAAPGEMRSNPAPGNVFTRSAIAFIAGI